MLFVSGNRPHASTLNRWGLAVRYVFSIVSDLPMRSEIADLELGLSAECPAKLPSPQVSPI